MKKLLVMSAAAAVLFAASAPAAFAATIDGDDATKGSGTVTIATTDGTLAFASVPDVAISGGTFGFENGDLVANYSSVAFVGSDGKTTAPFTVKNTDQSATSAYVQATVSDLPEGVTLKAGENTLGTIAQTVASSTTLTTGPSVALTSQTLSASVPAAVAADGVTNGIISYTLTDTLPTGQE